jgi:hypothetical protein
MIENGPHGDSFIARLGYGIRRLTPMAYRLQRTTRQIARRAMRKPRTVMEGPNLLPLLTLRLPGGGVLGAAQALPPGPQ